jgi:hypothetical protein
MSNLSKINRKLKSAMKLFIKHEDEGALRIIVKLSEARQESIKAEIRSEIRENNAEIAVAWAKEGVFVTTTTDDSKKEIL